MKNIRIILQTVANKILRTKVFKCNILITTAKRAYVKGQKEMNPQVLAKSISQAETQTIAIAKEAQAQGQHEASASRTLHT